MLLTRALTAEYGGKSNPGMVVKVFHSRKKDTFDNEVKMLRAAGLFKLLEASHNGDDNSTPLVLMKKAPGTRFDDLFKDHYNGDSNSEQWRAKWPIYLEAILKKAIEFCKETGYYHE